MGDDNIRAAAERVRRWKAGDWLSDIYPASKDHGMAVASLEVDWRDVAIAYLAANPADDGEPVTEDWLLAEGWHAGTTPSGHPLWKRIICSQDHGDGLGVTIHWLTIHPPQDDGHGRLWWPLNLWQQHSDDEKEGRRPDGVALLSWIDHTTRGHVRRAWAGVAAPDPG